MIDYILKRKNVKNINLRLKRDGTIIVSANPRVPLEYINKFVESKEEWILKNLRKFKEMEEKDSLEEGKTKILGEIVDSERIPIRIEEIAKVEFHESIDRMLPLLGSHFVEKPNLTIRKMKTRWGSCNKNKKSITLNLDLIKYPREIIDYVVLHELVHFVHFNHSKSFYDLLEGLMPDWKKRKNNM